MVRKIGSLMVAAMAFVAASPMLAMAQEGAASGALSGRGLIGLGAGIGIGIAALGGAFGQGRIGASAMESIGRNPNSTDRLFVPMIIGLAFVESLTLYVLVIAFLLMGKM
jgi:F-type H+-transporting ATPase subunit c